MCYYYYCYYRPARRRGVYLSYRDLQLYCSRPVIGLLEVFLLCFSSCSRRCTLSLSREGEGQRDSEIDL